MKKKLILIGLFLATSFANAQSKNTGIGLFVDRWGGGLHWKHKMDPATALAGAVRYNTDADYFGISVDYLMHNYGIINPPSGKAPLYYGVGAYLGGGGNISYVGLEGVFGIAYEFTAPFDVFFQLQPAVDVLPGTEVGLNASLGGHFWF